MRRIVFKTLVWKRLVFFLGQDGFESDCPETKF